MFINVTENKNLKAKPTDETKLGFGKIFTDYMFVMDYTNGLGWHDPQIIPYGPLSLDPACTCFHYGQEVFEGMKAYRGKGDDILLFRPRENFERLNVSNERLCIPLIDVDSALQALKQLVNIEKDWIPSSEGTSLYIRPFIIGCEPFLGVHAAANYKFIIILSPVGAYYASGLNPINIFVEQSYVRAIKGGTGFAKAGGNYAASLKAQTEAKGYSQVLWLDGIEHKYIEEVGAMNVFFVIGDEIVTPSLGGSILPGITRKSAIELLTSQGKTVVERRITIDEVMESAKSGELKEVFGTGTAAVISPVGELTYNNETVTVNNNVIGPIAQKLYDDLTGIQWGKIPDPFGWSVKI